MMMKVRFILLALFLILQLSVNMAYADFDEFGYYDNAYVCHWVTGHYDGGIWFPGVYRCGYEFDPYCRWVPIHREGNEWVGGKVCRLP